MEYRPLGRTGVQVSKLCLGTMMFGAWGNADHDDSIRIIHAALDAGVNFVDTADVYSAGESEEIVGKALKGRRDDVVLATKLFMPMGDDPNRRGGSRRWIVRAVEDSLRRLGTDWIDLYQVHRPEPGVDVEETLGALTDLVRQGKVRYIGSSSYSGSQIVEAQWAARERNLTYSPLSGGWLSGNWSAGSSPTSPARQRLVARFDMEVPGEPAQARRRRAAPAGRRRLRSLDDRAGHRLRGRPSWRHRGHHRPPHDGADGRSPRRRRRRARRRDPRCDRRGHGTRHDRRGIGPRLGPSMDGARRT